MESPLLNRAVFEDFASLFDAAELVEMLAQWHADCAVALASMIEALGRGDLAGVGELAHRAAGGALALGATGLARACEGLRSAAESADGAMVSLADVEELRAVVEASYVAMLGAHGDPSRPRDA